jgi:dolichyl-diphosphooligosaccharide--protein glycosyltransferase
LIASIFLGFAIAGQTLAWDASPILIAATGLAVVITALAAVETDRSPFITAVPTLVGLALGAGLTGAGHTVVGWHTARVAFAPTLVLGGSVLALGVAELVYRTTSDVRHLAVIDAVLFPIGIAVFRAHRPDDWNALASGTGRLTAERGIAETVGLFDPDSLGFVLLLGFTLVIALPAMVMGFQRARANPQWAVPTAYIWYFFGLSALSVRFVGEFALILAVFAGVGFVRLAAWIDVVKPLNFDVGRTAVKRLSVPDRQTFGVLVLLFLLVGSLGIVQVPVKTSQLTIEDSTYQSAAYIANHSDELNQSYPENYVLSQWGRNRVYNYFVNGQSESYGYARQTYAEFVRSPSADEWYDQFRGRVGYVVLESSVNSTTETAYAHLVNGYGSRTTRSDGVSHFRALYASPDGQKITYQVVPGANLTGQIEPNATVTVRTNVTIPGASFTYERQTTTDARGNYNVRVANPGTYVVRTDNETRETTVTAQSVRNGTRIQVDPA